MQIRFSFDFCLCTSRSGRIFFAPNGVRLVDMGDVEKSNHYDVIGEIRRQKPLVHAITNPVTMTDVVNLILASGATAICADDPKEAEEISAISDVTFLNIGMPSDGKLEAMLAAGKKANELGHPLILDPVGAGASPYRRKFLERLLSELHPTCIRGNQSEMAALMGLVFPSKGVEDVGLSLDPLKLRKLARELDTVLAVTGEVDYAVSPDRVLAGTSGTPLLKRITGSGCMLSGFLAASIGAWNKVMENSNGNHEDLLSLVHESLLLYGHLAELAEEEMKTRAWMGTMTFRTLFIDAVSQAAWW